MSYFVHFTDPSVIVKPAEKDEYQKKLNIILGTVFGFAGLVGIVIVIVICLYRRRRGSRSGKALWSLLLILIGHTCCYNYAIEQDN